MCWHEKAYAQAPMIFFLCEMNILFSLNLLIKKYPCVLQRFQLRARARHQPGMQLQQANLKCI